MTSQHADSIQRLRSGNDNFVAAANKFPNYEPARRQDLKDNGQHPFAIVLSCADSRVAPEATFDQGLGDLFVVRVAGNVANTSSIASIEYAVAHLKTRLIVVLGHEECGACKAAMGGGDNGYNLNHLLAHINAAVAGGGSTEDVVRNNAKHQVQELASRSEIIRKQLDDKDDPLKIVSAYYHLGDGRVEFDD